MEWSVSGPSSVSIDSIKTVAVLGAGTMGNGIAHVFARAGYKVILRDVEQRFLDRGMDTIAKNLDREIKKGKLAESEKGTVLGRLVPVTDMSAISNDDFLVEAVPEKLDIKRQLHRPRCLRRHHVRPPRRPRRFQVPRLPPAQKIRSRRLARPQIRPRVLLLFLTWPNPNSSICCYAVTTIRRPVSLDWPDRSMFKSGRFFLFPVSKARNP